MAGVALVQVSQVSDSASKPSGERPMLGLTAVFMACCTSGFASVYFEYFLKQSQEFWIKQFQLALPAFVYAAGVAIVQDGAALSSGGFFQGYDAIVLLTITFEASGGIIVATVTKYADSVAKNFATALSLTLMSALSAIFWDFEITPSFLLGAALTVLATFVYQNTLPPISKGQAVKLSLGFLLVLGLWPVSANIDAKPGVRPARTPLLLSRLKLA